MSNRRTIGMSCAVFLFAFSMTTSTAQAGLLGDVVGAAIAHHEEQKQRQEGLHPAGRKTFLTDHPVLGTVAGAAAGGAAEGAAVGAGHFVLDHKVAAVGVGVVGAVAADVRMRDDLHADHCVKTGFEWSCPGIPGQHVITVEWWDLVHLAETKELRKNMEKAGDWIPPTGSGCALHHIVPPNLNFSPFFQKTRSILKSCGIDFDSAENGVFLPDRKTNSACAGRTYHRNLHTGDYAKKLNYIIRGEYASNGCDGVRNALKTIKNELIRGVEWK